MMVFFALDDIENGVVVQIQDLRNKDMNGKQFQSIVLSTRVNIDELLAHATTNKSKTRRGSVISSRLFSLC